MGYSRSDDTYVEVLDSSQTLPRHEINVFSYPPKLKKPTEDHSNGNRLVKLQQQCLTSALPQTRRATAARRYGVFRPSARSLTHMHRKRMLLYHTYGMHTSTAYIFPHPHTHLGVFASLPRICEPYCNLQGLKHPRVSPNSQP